MKLWTGRFTKEVDERVNDFNSSIRFDMRLVSQDIAGSRAHARMLGKCGIITIKEADDLVCALSELEDDIASGKTQIRGDAEDIHTFIEAELTARLGDTGKKLHTARSRNDQVATDFKLYVRNETLAIRGMLLDFADTLISIAQKNTGTVMPGYTHLQRAQPVTFAHHLMAYVQMLTRDCGRLTDAYDRADDCPLGAGALASTTHRIDRDMTARELGFKQPGENSMDCVSDRDFALEFLSALSIVMVHISRLAEEIILWSSHEFKFIELDDAFATGSSIMPQKKNPDVAELARGKTGRVFGDLTALLTAMKGLPLAYNKDMQEDKEAVFDAADTVKLCLSAFIPMCATMSVSTANMRQAAANGFINATDCADYLVSKGMPFRDAYKMVGEIIKYCTENGKSLESLGLEGYRSFSPLFNEDIYNAISLEKCVAGRDVLGGPAPCEVDRQIKTARKNLDKYKV